MIKMMSSVDDNDFNDDDNDTFVNFMPGRDGCSRQTCPSLTIL